MKSISCVSLFALLVLHPAIADESCFAKLAATHSFSLGQPHDTIPSGDGKSVFYLRSGPRDTKLGLYQLDIASEKETALALPASTETLSVEEKARRERARQTLTGITDYALSDDSSRILAAQGDHLILIDLKGGGQKAVAKTGWIAPKLSPDGSAIAAVRDNDVHVVTLKSGQDNQLTRGGTDIRTNGLAEFAAAEELNRADGMWWSPDSQKLIYEHADSGNVEEHYISDPEHPQVKPVDFRYPRAGTNNAEVVFGIISKKGGKTIWIQWDHQALPYVADVHWPKKGAITLTLLNREQTIEKLVSVDPATGRTKDLITETDPAWVNIEAGQGFRTPGSQTLPVWIEGGKKFLWSAERNNQWQLEVHNADGSLDHVITSPDLPFMGLVAADEGKKAIYYSAHPTRFDTAIYRVDFDGGASTAITPVSGVHDVVANQNGTPAVMIDNFADASGNVGNVILDPDGKTLGKLPSVAEAPSIALNMQFAQVGPQKLDAMIVLPHDAKPQQKLPVILSVYAGPSFKTVLHEPYYENQCMADQGYAVVSVDGRGTPGRDHDFERAIKNNLIDLPLHDQIEGLQALGALYPQMDMNRVGVEGWSFGGYFTVMAMARRPDVFKAGVAGAPPVDFEDYDTAYTERYLGVPQDSREAYRVSNVLTYADALSRPLLIMHGITDDNVYFENTMKLTQALIKAGKTYNLILLPGTHMLTDPLLRTNVDNARMSFFKENLK